MVDKNRHIKFSARDGKEFDVCLTLPDGDDKSSAILLMPAIFGVDDASISLLNDCAAAGFIAAAPDYFFRTTPGALNDMHAAVARMEKHDINQGVADMQDSLDQLRRHPRCNGKVAVLGLCFGGLFAFLSGTRLSVDAIAAFHATRIHHYLDEVDQLSIPCSLHYGSADPVVPMDQVALVQSALEPHTHCEVVVHHNAAHNFSMPGKPGFDANIATRAKNAVFQCFNAI